MIRQIACAPWRGTARACDADRAETIHQYAWFTRLVVERDIAFQEIVTEFLHPCANTAGCAWGAEKQDARETHRQLHPRLPILDRRRSGREHLKRSVEKHRMQRILARPTRNHIRQSHSPSRTPGASD